MQGRVRFIILPVCVCAGCVVVVALHMLAHSMTTGGDPPIHIGPLHLALEEDGPPLQNEYIARGQTFFLIANEIWDVDTLSGTRCVKDRITWAQWQVRCLPDGEWRDLPGGTLEETDQKGTYRSVVSVCFDTDGDYQLRLIVDDKPGRRTDRPAFAVIRF